MVEADPSMRVPLRHVLRTLRRDDSGQSLIVIVSAMTVFLSVAGLAIDAATWMVRHHNAQVVADSAALAAAQCLADPNQSSTMFVNGSQTSVPKCTSASDTYDAQLVAVDYAAANGLAINTSDVSVDTSNKVVTVTAAAKSPGLFARLLGVATTTQSARAGAGWNLGQCTTAGQNCDFMFANSNDCGAAYVLIVSTQGASTINGNIQTNGSLDASETGNAGGINGTGTYGPGSCTSTTGGNNNPWNTSPPTQATSVIDWPIDYSKDFPGCGGAGEAACIPSGQYAGYPTWCTNAGATITLSASSNDPDGPDAPKAGNIYCASGSSTTLGDPSTWNGAVNISISGNGNNNIYEDSFVGGTINYSGGANATFSACGYTTSGFSSTGCQAPAPASTPNYPIFYAIDQDPSPSSCAAGTNVSTSCAFSMSSTGNLTFNGDMFVQSGTVSLNLQGNQSAGNTFIEGNAISATLAGNFNGDGPTVSGDGGGGGGAITLVQ